MAKNPSQMRTAKKNVGQRKAPAGSRAATQKSPTKNVRGAPGYKKSKARGDKVAGA